MTTIKNFGLALFALCALSLLVLFPQSAQADDRRLITGFEEIPTVFFLFDTSGSMHWSAQCTLEDYNAGVCDYLCPTGSCWVPANGDDVNSKLYQAKEALYQVIEQSEDINVGFATFNQDNLYMRRKHWVYRATEDGPSIGGTAHYPEGPDGTPGSLGDTHTFGEYWGCTNGSGTRDEDGDGILDREMGCSSAFPADLSDPWETTRMQFLSKPTTVNETAHDFFVENASGTWRIYIDEFEDPLGSPIVRAEINVRRCTNIAADPDCVSSYDNRRHEDIDFELVTDFDAWDVTNTRNPENAGFFSQGSVSDSPASNTCAGWDPNTDLTADDHNGYNIRFATIPEPDVNLSPLMDVGDVVPLDWRNDNKTKILQRLAPNLLLGESVPDFGVARYFEDNRTGSNDYLLLKDSFARPIISFGATPLGDSVANFVDFLDGTDGWLATAEDLDPSIDCRKTYLIALTDGNQSACGDQDPCDATDGTGELFDGLGVRTFVVGFGVDPTAITGLNRLECMADNGGTGITADLDGDGVADGPGVIYPQNQQELIDALVGILDQIQPDRAAFSTAAVPSVQAEAADKVFLSDFTPVGERSKWIGRVSAFLKPLPIDPLTGLLDFTSCDDLTFPPGEDPSSCFLWDAGKVILEEQAENTTLDPVGPNPDQRRIFYSEADGGDIVPRTQHYFEPTIEGSTAIEDAIEFDLWRGLDLPFDDTSETDTDATRIVANGIIDDALAVKTTPLDDDNFPIPLDYVLGDVFHSDPLLLGGPASSLYFLRDVPQGPEWTAQGAPERPRYRDFSLRHNFRRRMLLFGANDLMFHAVDAGYCQRPSNPALDPRTCVFTNGTGREIFAYVPRSAMPTAQLLAGAIPRHRFTVDGRSQAADVLIDPLHDGLDSINPPILDDREWRTVIIGGLREGGSAVSELSGDLFSPADSVPPPADLIAPMDQYASGYFALDVTQPDFLEALPPGLVDNNGDGVVTEEDLLEPRVPAITSPTAVPTCLAANPSDPRLSANPSECGPIPFGAPLWEFTDSILGLRLDEDDNGNVDLGFTWAPPAIGRIRVCTSDCGTEVETLEDRFVAVFGGGFDPDSRFQRGNFIYMVDIETGLTIYKFPVEGAIPSEIAAVDTDFDTYLDTLYAGTTAGFLYRVDLGPDEVGFPEIEMATIVETDLSGTDITVMEPRIINPDFRPLKILDVNDSALEYRPIYFRPSISYLSKFNRYAIFVGTGEREDLFFRGQPTGRFFGFVDNQSHQQLIDAETAGTPPFTPTVSTPLTKIDLADAPRGFDENLLSPGEGWWLELEADERLVTDPFALSGILVFGTFQPAPGGPTIVIEGSLCREEGVSNIYGVLSTNANGLLAEADDGSGFDQNDLVRAVTVDGLVSSPFTEQAQSKNNPPSRTDTVSIDALDERLEFIRDVLKDVFPGNCKFPPGYRLDIKTRNSSTEIDFIAPVPICVVEQNFREKF